MISNSWVQTVENCGAILVEVEVPQRKSWLKGCFYEWFRACDYLGQGAYMMLARIYSNPAASFVLFVFRRGMNRFFLPCLIAVSNLSVIAIWQPGTEVTA